MPHAQQTQIYINRHGYCNISLYQLCTTVTKDHITTYRIEGNIGRLQLWQIHYKNMYGEINFDEFEIPFKNFNTVLWLD